MSERTLSGGRYVLSQSPIGIGGMGTVWKAFDTVLHREVAVKELRIPEGLNPEERDKLRSRAMREARAAAGLDHPGIVTIHDVLDEGGRPWIVMRLLPGKSLDQAVGTDGPLSPRRAAELGVRLLEALTTAHANGVLHRDVKPQNVMLGADGRWMLTDFGIASVAGATRTLTATGMVTGTLGYVAPERLSGAEPGAAADLWALGATLYFAVEGQHAYDHDDLPAMIAAVLTRAPNQPKQAGPLAPVIAGLMERDPARRLDAETAKQRLLAIAGGYPTFENPTVRIADANKPTERFGGSTKVLRGGSTWTDHGAEPEFGGLSYLGGNRVLRALAWLQVALNGAIGALLALIVYGLSQGMPLQVLAVVAVAIGLGGWLGRVLVPRLARGIGLPTTLIGSALLLGEFIVGAGAMGQAATPLPAIVLAGAALMSFAGWHRLSRSVRQRIVPTAMLSQVTAAHRAIGFAAILLGGAVASVCFWLAETRRLNPFGDNYILVILVGAGIVVIMAALLAIPAVRAVSRGVPGRRPKRWAQVAVIVAALILPLFAGGQATAYAIDRMDDFTSVPDVCSSSVLSQDRVAEFIEDPPEQDKSSYSRDVSCEWQRDANYNDSTGAELYISVTKYNDSRAAARRLQSDREDERATVVDLQLGDGSIRHPIRDSVGSDDSLGVAVEVRIDNVLLQAEFEQSDERGRPDSGPVEKLASELVREIESRKPQR